MNIDLLAELIIYLLVGAADTCAETLRKFETCSFKGEKWELKVKIVTRLCPKKQVSLGSSGHEVRHLEEEWMKGVEAFWTFKILFPTSSPNTFRAVQTQSVQHFLFISPVCVISS